MLKTDVSNYQKNLLSHWITTEEVSSSHFTNHNYDHNARMNGGEVFHCQMMQIAGKNIKCVLRLMLLTKGSTHSLLDEGNKPSLLNNGSALFFLNKSSTLSLLNKGSTLSLIIKVSHFPLLIKANSLSCVIKTSTFPV